MTAFKDLKFENNRKENSIIYDVKGVLDSEIVDGIL